VLFPLQIVIWRRERFTSAFCRSSTSNLPDTVGGQMIPPKSPRTHQVIRSGRITSFSIRIAHPGPLRFITLQLYFTLLRSDRQFFSCGSRYQHSELSDHFPTAIAPHFQFHFNPTTRERPLHFRNRYHKVSLTITPLKSRGSKTNLPRCHMIGVFATPLSPYRLIYRFRTR
jgi:hypothetical protein